MNKNQLIVAWVIILLFLTSCASKPNYIAELKEVLIEWNDALEIASSTSRIALNQPVSRLQEIKRKTEKIEIPDRRKECWFCLLNYMDLRIKVFLNFMRDVDSDLSFYLGIAYLKLNQWELCLTIKEKKLLEIPEKTERLLFKESKQRLEEYRQEVKEREKKIENETLEAMGLGKEKEEEKAKKIEHLTNKFTEDELRTIFNSIQNSFVSATAYVERSYRDWDTQERYKNEIFLKSLENLEQRYNISREELEMIIEIGKARGWEAKIHSLR